MKTLRYALFLLLPLLTACTNPPPPADDATVNKDGTPANHLSDLPLPPATGYDAPTEYDNKVLVWSDEFVGTALDTTAWGYDLGSKYGGWGNAESQFYTRENATVGGGHLIITARAENSVNPLTQEVFKYTSSRIKTKQLQEFRYGRIDIRAALPAGGKGIWPALWMLGTGHGSGTPWPRCGEIDIMEWLGHKPDTLFGTAHFQETDHHGYSPGKTTLADGGSFVPEWHVYSIDWSEDRLEWLVDGRSYHVLERNACEADPWPFNEKFYFLINFAVGGRWPGYPTEETVFPQRLVVDYVRVYQ